MNQSSPPHWPEPARPPAGAPNVLIVMLDDVGFADFGCYGSEIETPTIDRLAHDGLRFTSFHTTAMCSTTRASLLTGRNHHSVGMGCLANFDSGYPGYRGKIASDALTLAEVLRPHGYRNYFVGKWHVTPLTQSGPTGPFDGWPLGRGFDHFYGFLDAETDQYSPELVRDNTHIEAPGDYSTGYHLSEDLIDNAVGYLKAHVAAIPDVPWMTMVMPGACHAPHQAPRELIHKYDDVFATGWDDTRTNRLKRQIDSGIVPGGTELPARNDGVKAWGEHSVDEHKVFTRLAAAYGAMLEHFDLQLGRLIDWLDQSGQLDNTLVMVLSDNGASQEGGPLGYVNAMGPYNHVKEPLAEKLARIDDIGGPDTHANFPWGWAMAANTPLRRYKQNTHGGGVRDPLVVRWPGMRAGCLPDPGGLRHQFCHVQDLAPTILDLIGVSKPASMEGTSFASALSNADAVTGKRVQHFEMFGHRGIWVDGYKAVAYHKPGTDFDADRWELYHLDEDFNEQHNLADANPAMLKRLVDQWWIQAERYQVLPLDDRFAERFAENAARFTGQRTDYTFWRGLGHVPSEVAPDLRSRSYDITAHVQMKRGDHGVLIAHGDATGGYSLFVRDGRLVHDLNIGGKHQLVVSDREVPSGPCTLGFQMRRSAGQGAYPEGVGILLINGEPAGEMRTNRIFWLMISWSGLDIGFDRGTTVSDYDGSGRFIGPYRFTGELSRVHVHLVNDQNVDFEAAASVTMSRE
ncbi:MAG: arylsulfatase [Burkholderiaceae bacterium]